MEQAFDGGSITIDASVIASSRRAGGAYGFGVVAGSCRQIAGVDAGSVVLIDPEPVNSVWDEVGDRAAIEGVALEVFSGSVVNHLFARSGVEGVRGGATAVFRCCKAVAGIDFDHPVSAVAGGPFQRD